MNFSWESLCRNFILRSILTLYLYLSFARIYFLTFRWKEIVIIFVKLYFKLVNLRLSWNRHFIYKLYWNWKLQNVYIYIHVIYPNSKDIYKVKCESNFTPHGWLPGIITTPILLFLTFPDIIIILTMWYDLFKLFFYILMCTYVYMYTCIFSLYNFCCILWLKNNNIWTSGFLFSSKKLGNYHPS